MDLNSRAQYKLVSVSYSAITQKKLSNIFLVYEAEWNYLKMNCDDKYKSVILYYFFYLSCFKKIKNDKYYQQLIQLLFQINFFRLTIASNHPIRLTGLKLLEEKLDTNDTINFYFVVPTKLFRNY